MYIPKNLLFPPKGISISKWRRELKTGLLWRDTYCYCGKPLVRGVNIDMHEGLISRAEIMGCPKELRLMMYNELNCVLICHDCNVGGPPSRKQVWREQHERYGEELEKWYSSLQELLKHNLRRFQ